MASSSLKRGILVEGRDLKPLSQIRKDERDHLLSAQIFARVTPAQKLDLVTLYQSAGDVVAMTGDGVNDAPALQKADIGVAMGLRGTEVAREAAAIVLRDDAFGSIVAAIREGRVIFNNIRRFVVYLLSCNISEVMIVALAVLTGLPLPILPLQILFLNLVTDVFPAFALATGEGEEDVLRRPPRDAARALCSGDRNGCSLWEAPRSSPRRRLALSSLATNGSGLRATRSSPCRFSPLPSPSSGMCSTCAVPAQNCYATWSRAILLCGWRSRSVPRFFSPPSIGRRSPNPFISSRRAERIGL